MEKVLKDDLGLFCYCSECSAENDSNDCRDILDSDGLTKATDEKGCGFLNK